MNQLTPSQKFPIVRQLDNAQDPSTYYLQAVVYSASNAVLATVNLIGLGNQRFSGIYTPPPDPTGNGFYINITINVYTDSGYSQLSPVYSTTSETYQVIQTPNLAQGFSGGADGGDFDPKLIRKIIQEELKLLKLPEYKSLGKDDILSLITGQLEPISSGLEEVKQHVSGHTGKLVEMMNRNQTRESDIIGGFGKLFDSHSENLLKANLEEHSKYHKILNDTAEHAISNISTMNLTHEARMKEITDRSKDAIGMQMDKVFNDEADKRRTEKERLLKAMGDHMNKSIEELYSKNPISRKKDYSEGINKLLKSL